MPARPGRPIDLGQDLQRLPPLTLEGLAEHGLRLGVRVYVGGVKGGDADIERSPYASLRLIVFDLRTMREPVAVSNFRDLESRVPDVPKFHHDSCRC